MGKNRRERRVEERDSYAARSSAQKRKNYVIASGVLGLVVVLIGITSYNGYTSNSFIYSVDISFILLYDAFKPLINDELKP